MVLALALGLLQIDQARIDEAIRKGVEFLKTAESPAHHQIAHADELLLYTLVVADVPATDDRVRRLLDRVLREPPLHTYRVALQAMALEEIDRVRHQERIAQCAQHLVDNQCANGQWSYGEATAPRREDGVASGGGGKGLRRIVIRPQRSGPPEGDNSNSQYAALGLRACHDAGIVIPEATLRRADRWWEATITAGGKRPERPAIASGGGESPQGWGYTRGEAPYNTMTAGGVGCLILYDHLQKRDWRKNPRVKDGMAWMAAHAWFDRPPQGITPFWYFYYLYAVERVGMLSDTPLIGRRDWYLEGARWLLEQQAANGSWDQNRLYPNPSNASFDTCFAVLFLKKATKGLTASVEKR